MSERRTLVIETATAALSIALIERGGVVASAHEIVGRGHAERLIPLIAELPDGGRADAVLVDCGPGSFTGVRVGLAAARALALGWGVPVGGYSLMDLLAAQAASSGNLPARVTVAVNGGHGELFVQRFATDPLAPDTELASLPPADAAIRAGAEFAVGSGAAMLIAAQGRGRAEELWPRAADAVLLAPATTRRPPSPIYGRAPDAKPAA